MGRSIKVGVTETRFTHYRPAIQTFGTATAAAAFAPTDIAGLIVWFKADALALNNNDPVGTWTDSSGNGNDATQATAGKKPLWIASGQNGLPVVRFDSVNDAMATAAFAELTQPNTVIVVGSLTGDGAMFYDGIVDTSRELLFTNNAKWSMYAGTGFVEGGTLDASFHVHASLYNGATSKHRTDGGAADATGNAGAHTLTGLTLGTNYTLAGGVGLDMGELLVYNANVSNANLNLIGAYLERWGTTWTAVS